MRIPRRFAIAAKEVTVEQFQRFLKQPIQSTAIELRRASSTSSAPIPNGPRIGSRLVHGRPLLQLAERAGGFAEGPVVLPPQRGRGLRRGDDDPCRRSGRTGYRLPTEAEWEYACRAGTVTSRYYGHSIDLLDAYARYQANSKEHAWTCGSLLPNDLGLFDMLGNVYEWCQDG